MIALISLALTLFTLVLLVRAVLSWFPRTPPALTGVRSAAYTITEPVVAPVRRVVPSVGGLDLSVLAVFFAIYVVRIIFGI